MRIKSSTRPPPPPPDTVDAAADQGWDEGSCRQATKVFFHQTAGDHISAAPGGRGRASSAARPASRTTCSCSRRSRDLDLEGARRWRDRRRCATRADLQRPVVEGTITAVARRLPALPRSGRGSGGTQVKIFERDPVEGETYRLRDDEVDLEPMVRMRCCCPCTSVWARLHRSAGRRFHGDRRRPGRGGRRAARLRGERWSALDELRSEEEESES